MFAAIPTRLDDPRDWQGVPIANAALIAINVMLYFFSGLMHVGPGTGVLSVISYAFAHGSIPHLVGNMWVLWVIGNPVNRRVGNLWYFVVYLGAVLVMGLLFRFLLPVNVLGASGVIFAVIMMALLLMPASMVSGGFVAVLPMTLLIGLFKRPKHWLGWLIRWDSFRIRAIWFLLIVPLMELGGMLWLPTHWYSHLGHLLGLGIGVAIVLMLPERVTMNRDPLVAGTA